MINEMSKFEMLYLLNKRTKTLTSTLLSINKYCDNNYEKISKELISISNCFLHEIAIVHNTLYNFKNNYYKDISTKIKIIVKNVIKEIINIEAYCINFYLLAIEYENLEKFLCEYRIRLLVATNNLKESSNSLKEIKDKEK